MLIHVFGFSQIKYFNVNPFFLKKLKIELNNSFQKTIENEKNDLINRGIKDSVYLNKLDYKIGLFENNDTLIYYNNMPIIFDDLESGCKNLEIENMYVISFQSDENDIAVEHNFIIIDNYNLIRFYGLKTKRNQSFYFKNSFSFNFKEFFLNLPYSYFNVKTSFTGGIHHLLIAKITGIGENIYKIETKVSHTLLPYQENYLKYLLGIKLDLSFP